jgi:hypothetical protein
MTQASIMDDEVKEEPKINIEPASPSPNDNDVGSDEGEDDLSSEDSEKAKKKKDKTPRESARKGGSDEENEDKGS